MPGTTISSTSVNSDLSDIATALSGSVAADGQTPITGPLTFSDGTATSPSLAFTTNTNDGIFHPAAGQVGIALAGVQGITFAAPAAATGGGILGPASVILSPIGVVQDFAGSSAPTGWFLCYGQAISRTTYAELFAVISTVFGIGDGTTTFNLPDLRGRGSYGKDDMGGSAANRITNAVSGITGTTLGASGGDQKVTIGQTNLPNVTVTVPSLALTGSATVSLFSGGGSGPSSVALGSASGSVTQTQSAAVTGSTSAGVTGALGSGTALGSMNPALILNKIIFAGRP